VLHDASQEGMADAVRMLLTHESDPEQLDGVGAHGTNQRACRLNVDGVAALVPSQPF
jgi:hypothetical protein